MDAWDAQFAFLHHPWAGMTPDQADALAAHWETMAANAWAMREYAQVGGQIVRVRWWTRWRRMHANHRQALAWVAIAASMRSHGQTRWIGA